MLPPNCPNGPGKHTLTAQSLFGSFLSIITVLLDSGYFALQFREFPFRIVRWAANKLEYQIATSLRLRPSDLQCKYSSPGAFGSCCKGMCPSTSPFSRDIAGIFMVLVDGPLITVLENVRIGKTFLKTLIVRHFTENANIYFPRIIFL